jgi:acyl-CoA dehydrogenase
MIKYSATDMCGSVVDECLVIRGLYGFAFGTTGCMQYDNRVYARRTKL